MIQIHPLSVTGEIRPGDDLVRLLVDTAESAAIVPRGFDVLAVTQKIVSKAEGRFVDLATVRPGSEAVKLAALTRKDPRLVELILSESSDIVRAAPHILITRHRSGHVMANAGIDQSNTGPSDRERVLLLPLDSDASAERLRKTFATLWSKPAAVLIMDSFGRPWRHGVTCVALGASGLPSLVDHRGELDRDGRALEVTQVALADMIATAAGLVTGEGAESVPAAIVQGLRWTATDRPVSALIRPIEEDLFR